ncbi:MAG: hypothetical protein QM530_09905 [Phycisphaerales bacterium]|nr:hypothetical protein [Phycisphaerales bacterium]
MNITAKKTSGFILLATIMILLFNPPILAASNQVAFVWGIPSLYLYLFATWLFCIIVLMLITHFRKSKRKNNHE